MMRSAVRGVVGSLFLLGAACTSGGGSGPASGSGGKGSPGSGGSGGGLSGSGGSTSGTGGTAAGAGPDGGSTLGSGGTAAGTGGASTGTGGAASTGGIGGNGGTVAGTGGSPAATGGSGPSGSGGSLGTGGAPAPCAAPISITTGTAATVTVNLGATPMATVSPDLIGVHTAVYDSLLTTTPTTPTLLKAGGITSLRYPGGSYADLYHWETNTGTATPAAGFGSNTIFVAPTANFGSFISVLQNTAANALITVNYGMNSAGTGPAVPQEAAAWVAYANGIPSSTTSIGTDANGVNWMTVGYWAGLRAAAPLATDDGKNFLRINHPAPVGIKYWEIGNELYGNGYYQGSATSAGWEADLHAPYNGTNGTARRGNAALSPTTYGMGVKAFSAAMKAVDPTIKIGGIVTYPDTAYAAFNTAVMAQACTSMDFAVVHWYPGSTIPSLLTVARTELPALFTSLHGLLSANCPAGTPGAAMPIAISEWGPNINNNNGIFAALVSTVNAGLPPTQTQVVGLFAAESYATLMEQGALAAHWAQLHDASFLGAMSTATGWGYHGAVMAHFLAGGGDSMLPPPVVSNAGALMSLLYAHASQHVDGTVSVMLTNTSPTVAANVTVNVAGGTTMLGCSGFRYAYTPVGTNLDGAITTAPIFSSTTRTSINVAVPAYSVVVVAFPKG